MLKDSRQRLAYALRQTRAPSPRHSACDTYVTRSGQGAILEASESALGRMTLGAAAATLLQRGAERRFPLFVSQVLRAAWRVAPAVKLF